MEIIDSIPDTDEQPLDYDTLDPGIRAVVRWLRRNGFDTCDSGDGKSKPPEWFAEGEALRFPHVSCVVEPPDMLITEADRLHQLVTGAGIVLNHISDEGVWPRIEASYCPGSRVAILALLNVHDGMLPWVS